MNKKGTGKANALVWVLSIFLVTGITFGLLFGFGVLPVKPAATPTGAVPGQTAIPGTQNLNIVTTNPTPTVGAIDALAQGTSVSNTLTMQVNNGGGFVATAAVVPGQIVELRVVNGTGYHSNYVAPFEVKVGSFPKQVLMNKNGSVTENIYSTTGVVMTDNYATANPINQTRLGNGMTYTFKDDMVPGSNVNTQDMVCLIEIEDGTNVSSMTYDGAQPINTAKPKWYTGIGATSAYYQFAQPALSLKGVTKYIEIATITSGSLQAATDIIKTCYTKEWYLDTDGVMKFGIENSQGTRQSIGVYKYQFQIA